MATPYVGEIRSFGFNFAPVNWAMCAGQLMPIGQNEALYQLIGTTYGGDGVNTFGLPDLQGRAIIHQGTDRSGNTYVIGQRSGTESVTLISNQMPIHTHTVNAQPSAGTLTSPSNAYFAGSPADQYAPPDTSSTAAMLLAQGGGQPHNNVQPYVAITYCISLFGIFPSQN